MWENGWGQAYVGDRLGIARESEYRELNGQCLTISSVMPSSGARGDGKWGEVAVTDGVTTVTQIIRPVGLVILHQFPGGAMTTGVVWCGVVWCGVVWYGVVRCAVELTAHVTQDVQH